MQKKKGISLIVLVITIIVMIILAAAIIVSLNNNNIIGKAKDAVDETNLKQVQELAQTIWAEAYIKGARTQQELYDAVIEGLEEANVDTSKYTIIVTTNGATVTTQTMNEYGFYFDMLYEGELEESFMGITEVAFVFHEDGSAEGYGKIDGLSDSLYCIVSYEEGNLIYSKNKIEVDGSDSDSATVTDEGLTITGTFEGLKAAATYTGKKTSGIYYNKEYEGQAMLDGQNVLITTKLDKSLNYTTVIKDLSGNVLKTVNGKTTSYANGQQFEVEGADFGMTGKIPFSMATDGKSILLGMEAVLYLKDENSADNTGGEELAGAVITPVEGSSVEAIKAGNPKTGDAVEYNGYIYKYNQSRDNTGAWQTIDFSEFGEGWGVAVQDTTLETYPDMESTIYTVPVKYLVMTFVDCTNMVTAPALSSEACTLMAVFYNCTKLTSAPILPDSATDMFGAFYKCTSLTTVQNLPSNLTSLWCAFQYCEKLTTIPELPSKITNMCAAFDGCTLLTSVSAIPATVTNLMAAFRNCTSLEGTITINATSVSDYSECFKGTSKSITLAKTSCPVLSEIAATATGGNVIVAE